MYYMVFRNQILKKFFEQCNVGVFKATVPSWRLGVGLE